MSVQVTHVRMEVNVSTPSIDSPVSAQQDGQELCVRQVSEIFVLC